MDSGLCIASRKELSRGRPKTRGRSSRPAFRRVQPSKRHGPNPRLGSFNLDQAYVSPIWLFLTGGESERLDSSQLEALIPSKLERRTLNCGLNMSRQTCSANSHHTAVTGIDVDASRATCGEFNLCRASGTASVVIILAESDNLSSVVRVSKVGYPKLNHSLFVALLQNFCRLLAYVDHRR